MSTMIVTPQMDIENTLDIIMLHINTTLHKINITPTNARLIAFNELLKYGVDEFHKNESSVVVTTLVENTIDSLITYESSLTT